MPTSTTTITKTTTTTIVPPPPPEPQQDISTSILIQTIGQLEQNIADLVEANQSLEERLGKQGNRIHQLEKSVKEVVTASVQHAMRAPLRARFKDLPTSDMKEILLQLNLKENYDKGHKDHKMDFKALQKSIIHDESEQFDADKAEEKTKKKRASGPTRTFDSAQDPPPPPSSSTTNRGDESQSFAALGSSKITALTEYTTPEPAWSIPSSSLPTGDIGEFIDLFCKKHGIIELTPKHLEGPAYEVVKAFHPDGDKLALSITKMKAASYPDAGLEQMVPDQMWAEGVYMIMRFNEIQKFSDGTLQQIDEALDYRVKEFKVNKVNPGLNTRFWTKNDVIKSKQFLFAIQKRLKLM
ncbi:hypothetical protein Tco_0475892 [Tanacetum coccineum]